MKIESITLIFVCLILPLAIGPGLPFFRDISAYAQLIQDSSSISQLQRLGTTNILNPPNDVSLVFSNHKNSSLDEQFVILGILGNNLGTRQKIAILLKGYFIDIQKMSAEVLEVEVMLGCNMHKKITGFIAMIGQHGLCSKS